MTEQHRNPLVAAESKIREREEALAAALKDGRLIPKSLAAWRADWDARPEATAKRLGELAAGIPVGEAPEMSAEEAQLLADEFTGAIRGRGERP